jgi:hypothetical protein
MKINSKLAVTMAVFALSLGFGVGSPAAVNCSTAFQHCLADHHSSKAMCLEEYRLCRLGNP